MAKIKHQKMLKVLLDENLSPAIINDFKKSFVHYSHVYYENLKSAPDIDIWEYAKENDFDVIVTNDNDFRIIAEVKAMDEIMARQSLENTDLSNQPFVIHTSRIDGDHGRVARLFNKHARLLVDEIEKSPRKTAYLALDGDRFVGKSVSEIFNRFADGRLKAEGKVNGYKKETVNIRALNKQRALVGLPELKL